MAYDPQRDRPRPRPGPGEASIVDSILDAEMGAPMPPAAEPDPDPVSGPRPPRADSWSDRLLYSAGISTLLGAGVAAAALGWLWRRRRRGRR